MFQFEPLPLQDAFLLRLPLFSDNRGVFTKTFQEHFFLEKGIRFELKESYFSVSGKDVIRGMHFQTPPYQHSKIVFCPAGAILDVIVDLRKASSTYGSFYSAVLSAENHNAYFIPEGFAHGFKALTPDAMTYYLVSSEHSKDHDAGIRFDSFGMDWACSNPVLSERDLSFSALHEFESPF